MAKTKRSKSALIACPVQGCEKRGTRSAILQHASAKHPQHPRERIIAAINAGEQIAAAPHRAEISRRQKFHFGTFLKMAAMATAVLVILVLLYGQLSENFG